MFTAICKPLFEIWRGKVNLRSLFEVKSVHIDAWRKFGVNINCRTGKDSSVFHRSDQSLQREKRNTLQNHRHANRDLCQWNMENCRKTSGDSECFPPIMPAHNTHCHMSELLMKIFYYEVAPQDCKTSWQKVNMLSGHVLLLPGQGHPKTAMWWRPAGG